MKLEDLEKKEVRHEVYKKTYEEYVADNTTPTCLCDAFRKIIKYFSLCFVEYGDLLYYLPEFAAKKPTDKMIRDYWWKRHPDKEGREIRTEILKQLIEETK